MSSGPTMIAAAVQRARAAQRLIGWLRAGRVVLALGLAGAAVAAAAVDTSQIVEPSAVAVQMSPVDDPARLSDRWQAGTLPDNWARSHPGLRGPNVWYRVEFELPARAPTSGSWALYIPYLYDGGRLWLNGQPLASIAQTTEQTHVRWERPHLIAMPDALLKVGRNELLLRAVLTDPGAGLRLQRLSIGPAEELLPLYDRRMFWVRTMPQGAVVTCLVVGAFVLFVWWRRRSEVLYGLFGLAALLWSVRTLTFVIEVLPEAWWPWWRAVYHAATGGFIVVLALFSIRIAGLRLPRLERGLAAYWAIGPLAMLLSGGRLDSLVGFAWTGGIIPIGLAVVGFSAYAAWTLRSGAAWALLIAEAMAAAAGIHDYLIAWDGAFTLPALAGEWLAHRIFLLHHGANLLLLVMVAILTQRFVQALDTTEALNRDLESRVAARERELKEQHEAMLRLEREQAVLEERQRMMQDLHDGLGSQLFTALSRAERSALDAGGVAQVLRDCIADMRLVFDATAPDTREIGAVFGDFLHRWRGLLRDGGVTLATDLAIPADLRLPPATTLQLLRIAQEALTNALRHAGAREVRVALRKVPQGLELGVRDDGRGIGAHRSAGRGLPSMQQRARRLGGTLAVRSDAQGTEIVLQLPGGGDAV